jgi:O-succinylbenzoate synthase
VLELPNDRRIAEAYARGELLLDAIPDLEQRLSTAWDWITAAARRTEVAS